MSSEDVQKFLQDYNAGKFPGQRLGQAFVNKFGHDRCANHHGAGPCLFYMDDARAVKAVWEMVT